MNNFLSDITIRINQLVRSHPFRFLLNIEWILLVIVVLGELLPSTFYQLPRLPLLNLFCLAIFAVMGLFLPKEKLIQKVAYTNIEIVSIMLASVVGGLRFFPILYLIVALRNCLIFKKESRWIVTGIIFVFFLVTLIHKFNNFTVANQVLLPERLWLIFLSFSLVFGLTLIFLLLLVDAIIFERKNRAKLRQYALSMEDLSTLQERARLASEMHNSLAHYLTIMNVQLETGLKLWQSDSDKAVEFVLQAKQMSTKILADLRQFGTAIQTDTGQDISLAEAIASLVEEFYRTANISPICNIQTGLSLSNEMKNAIYRIVQEALSNIYKYAAATEVIIEIQTRESYLYLTIQDNGRGFNLDENTAGFGLQKIRESTLALQGKFDIQTAPGAGCKISATLPLD